MNYKENVLTYEDYFRLRESVGWMNFSKEQAQRALSNSIYTVIAEKGVEDFYKKAGFKVIPHEHCGFGMRKIINKSAMF